MLYTLLEEKTPTSRAEEQRTDGTIFRAPPIPIFFLVETYLPLALESHNDPLGSDHCRHCFWYDREHPYRFYYYTPLAALCDHLDHHVSCRAPFCHSGTPSPNPC